MSLLLAIANVPSVKIWLTDLHKMAEKTINHTELTAQLATITLTEILTPLANSGPKTHAWRERKKKQERVWNILPGLTASGWIVIYCRYVAGETREVRSNNSIYIIGKLKLCYHSDHVPFYLVLLYLWNHKSDWPGHPALRDLLFSNNGWPYSMEWRNTRNILKYGIY